LRWRCRRGLLENDLFIERFFAAHDDATITGAAGRWTGGL
jgi:antitoxin CptB